MAMSVIAKLAVGCGGCCKAGRALRPPAVNAFCADEVLLFFAVLTCSKSSSICSVDQTLRRDAPLSINLRSGFRDLLSGVLSAAHGRLRQRADSPEVPPSVPVPPCARTLVQWCDRLVVLRCARTGHNRSVLR